MDELEIGKKEGNDGGILRACRRIVKKMILEDIFCRLEITLISSKRDWKEMSDIT